MAGVGVIGGVGVGVIGDGVGVKLGAGVSGARSRCSRGGDGGGR